MMTVSPKTISVSSRIRNAILGLALGLCLVFGGFMFLIMFIVEDEIFVKQIHAEQNDYEEFLKNRSSKDSQQRWRPTNGNMRMLESISQLQAELPKDLPDEFLSLLLEHSGIYEYFDGQHALFISHQKYHGKTGFLIYDVSKLLAVRGSKTTLFSLILIITLIAALLSIVIAHTLSKSTLAPIKTLINELQEHGFNSTVINQARQFSTDEIGILTHELALAIESQNTAAKREFEFNRGVSHELRSPIQVAQSTCELLIAMNSENSAMQLNKPLGRLQRATEEMSEIAHTFLILSNKHGINHQGNCQRKQLKDLINNNERDNVIEIIDLVDDSHNYPMDASMLRIILRHLIRNADTHGIEDSTSIEFNEYKISVNNTIMYDQTSSKGYGIGLNIVKALCERSNHSLLISNSDGIFKADIVFNSQSV